MQEWLREGRGQDETIFADYKINVHPMSREDANVYGGGRKQKEKVGLKKWLRQTRGQDSLLFADINYREPKIEEVENGKEGFVWV